MTDDDLLRYSRHLLLEDLGIEGQRRLLAAHALVVGAGGLGSPVALYLAAAGVGTIGLVDFDAVDLSNLQRQILHGSSGIGSPKTDSARDRLRDINPNVLIEASGGMDLDRVRSYAEAGVDLISVGRITHSARAVDISFKIQIA